VVATTRRHSTGTAVVLGAVEKHTDALDLDALLRGAFSCSTVLAVAATSATAAEFSAVTRSPAMSDVLLN
jgi:hypothetical protein